MVARHAKRGGRKHVLPANMYICMAPQLDTSSWLQEDIVVGVIVILTNTSSLLQLKMVMLF